MTTATVLNGRLIVDVQGWDKLWALKSRLEIPLEHVKGVCRAEDERPKGIRVPGTYVPGVTTAGTFRQVGRKVFWNVHNPEKAIAIELQDEQYSSLVIEVTEPEATIRELESAIAPVTA